MAFQEHSVALHFGSAEKFGLLNGIGSLERQKQPAQALTTDLELRHFIHPKILCAEEAKPFPDIPPSYPAG